MSEYKQARAAVGRLSSNVAELVPFAAIKHAVSKQFESMKAHTLYRVDLSRPQAQFLNPEQRAAETGRILWEAYLAAFPVGTNPVFRERTDHDCSCCRHFVKTMGAVVAIIDGELATIWDGLTEGFYVDVQKAMRELVRTGSIDNIFLHPEKAVGTEKNFQQVTKYYEDGSCKTAPLTWEHFHVHLPASAVVKKDQLGPALSEHRSTFDVFKRGLEELTLESVDTVLELVAQNSIYRGEEQKFAVSGFRELKVAYERIDADGDSPHPDEFCRSENTVRRLRDKFVWKNLNAVNQSISRIRNTAVGTLLTDLSEGKDVDEAVKSFESKVAPANYKRPTALVTKAMIQKAQAKIEELGYTSALERRYAHIDDITVNNILFADRKAAKLSKSVFDELAAKVPENTKKLDKVEEVSVEKFLADVLPKAESVEVLLENRHVGNLVSLIAPVDPGSKNMFKWPNNFSWSYAGDVADSLKERVKAKGGNVAGDLRCSLSWFNWDDLDLHMVEPGGSHIFYHNKTSWATGGVLDVDMNPGGGSAASAALHHGRYSRSAVENISYADKRRMPEGTYKLQVNNYAKVEAKDVGFEAEVEFDGQVHSFAYDKAVRQSETVTVAELSYTRKDGFKVVQSLPSSQAARTVWGVSTGAFHKVNVVMLSPNYWWDESALRKATRGSKGQMGDLSVMETGAVGVGNKHWFFMLDGCRNEEKARGFYNEFLSAELEPHRKTMEMVGAKMRTDEAERQLSGLGFSSTRHDSLTVRVKGSFQRVVKVVF